MSNYVSFYFVNNLGVSLLERGQYQDAMNTFQDAIHVYHYLCSQEPQRCEQTCSSKSLLSKMSIDNDIIHEEIIIRASNRLSCCGNREQQHNIALHVIDSELDPMIALDVTDDYYFTSLVKFGLSIDQIDFVIRMNDNLSSSEYNKGWKLDFAMLIFNFGVACKRSSEVSPDKYGFSEECQNILREKSIELFYMAHCIVVDGLKTYTTAIQMKSIYTNQDNVWCALHALIISILTAAHIRDMMYWGHSNEEGMKYNIKFENSFRFYITLVQEYMKRYGSSSTKHAAVA